MSEYAQVIQQLTLIQNWINDVNANNKNTGQFVEATELNTGDFADIFQGGVNKKAPLSLLSSFVNSRVDLTENVYQTIDGADPELHMLADQANQTQGQVQYVLDASFDPTVLNGPAYYEYIAETPTGDLVDYRKLSDDEVVEIQEASSFYTFSIKEIGTSLGTNTPTNTIKIEYENVGDKITGILFNSIFSKYLSAFSSLTSVFDFNVKIFNKTQKKTLIGTLTTFTFTNPSNNWYLVGVDQTDSPMDRNDLEADDVVEVQITVQKKAAAQKPPIENAAYVDMTALYVDQANQTLRFFQEVTDASGHPDIGSGSAIFQYLGTTNGDETDYKLWVDEELKTRVTANEVAIQAIVSSYSRRPKVINITDNTAAPPSEVLGDRYILDFTGASHVDWDGAAAGDIVEFNGTTWDATTPFEGWITYLDDQNKDALFVDDGSPTWEVRDVIIVDHSALNLDDGTNPHGTTQTDVGLGNVDNTSDADKPVSTAQQTALDGKVDDSQIIDEDDMSSDSDAHVPTQQSVKAYVDNQVVPKTHGFAATDELTEMAASTVTDIYTESMPYAITISEFFMSVNVAPVGGPVKVAFYKNGLNVHTTDPEIDDGNRSTLGSSVVPVIVTGRNVFAKGDILTVRSELVGTTTKAKGLKITLIE